MKRRALLAAFLFLAGCRPRAIPASGEAGGRFELSVDGRRRYAAPATASWCDSDSSLTIVAISDDGAGGVAAKFPWPPGGDSLRIERRLSRPGVATFAFRPLGDSVRMALAADSGVARLTGDSAQVDGTASGWASTSDTTHVRLDARVRGVPVVQRCGGEVR